MHGLHDSQARTILGTAATSMFIAIACGAFGAHGLKKVLEADMLAIWQTAVQYQVMHSLAMLLMLGISERFPRQRIVQACAAFFIGIIVFSGSLYVLAITGLKWMGAITPIGGVAFLAGWVLVLAAAFQGRQKSEGSLR